MPERQWMREGQRARAAQRVVGGCGVPTGWGSSVYAAGVQAGDAVVIFGSGGVGSNSVQGARFAGAQHVVVVDPVEFKREMATSVSPWSATSASPT